MENYTIRIKLESFNHNLLNYSCKILKEILENLALNSVSIAALPTKKRIYCVLRSPHVDKDSREHFEIRVYKRILEISYAVEDKNNNTFLDLLSNAPLPSGVLFKLAIL